MSLETTVRDVGYLTHVSRNASVGYSYTDDELLGSFLDQYPDIGKMILSYHYGSRDYILECKYDNFYHSIPLHLVSMNFRACYKSEQICHTVVSYNPMRLRLVPESMKTRSMCIQALGRTSDVINSIPMHFLDYKTCVFLYKIHLYYYGDDEMVQMAEVIDKLRTQITIVIE